MINFFKFMLGTFGNLSRIADAMERIANCAEGIDDSVVNFENVVTNVADAAIAKDQAIEQKIKSEMKNSEGTS